MTAICVLMFFIAVVTVVGVVAVIAQARKIKK